MADQVGAGGGTVAGWYPDPQGRYEQRYHDGTAWTSHVSTGGTVSTDDAPLAMGMSPGPARMSPYGGPTGASLYGTPGYGMAPGGSMGGIYRPPIRFENRVGPGLAIYLAGIALLVVSLTLPWLDGHAAFDLTIVRTTAYGTVTDTNALGVQVGVSFLYAAFWLFLTCFPFQPGKLLGFLGAGCIGLLVFWQPLDSNAPSKRSNVMGVVILLLHLGVIWATFIGIKDDYAVTDAKTGLGPFLLTVAYLVMMVGASLGRRRVRVEPVAAPGYPA